MAEDNYLDANHKYEQALSVFVWAENTHPDWKNRGMRDEDLKEGAYTDFKSEAEKNHVEKLMTACYLNLALCCQKSNEHNIAIRACDEVLARYDAKNIKALYRRAISRIAPASSGGLEVSRRERERERESNEAKFLLQFSNTVLRRRWKWPSRT